MGIRYQGDRMTPDVERPPRSRGRQSGGAELFFVDVFDASRRPVSALETARNRDVG
jgi:hypothetical protein